MTSNNSINIIQPGFYLGKRDSSFKQFIKSVLSKSNLKDKYIDILTDDKNILLYNSAFTSDLIDHTNNYQVYEQLGDVICNKFVVDYMYKRFPYLRCSEGVKIVARLKINYGSKQSFYEIGQNLGFWEFISAPIEIRNTRMKNLIEDVFEAFMGVTEFILDTEFRTGVGYAICYNILEHIFNQKKISLEYEDLYDSKTRLKEIFDMYNQKLGKLVYKSFGHESKTQLTTSIVYRIFNNDKTDKTVEIKLAEGKASLQIDAEQAAAKEAIKVLNKQGYQKAIPKIYTDIKNIQSIDIDHLINIKIDADNINILQSNGYQRIKTQVKYLASPLCYACKAHNYNMIEKILEMKGDPSITDSYNMTCYDLLFINSNNVSSDTLKNILELFLKHNQTIVMHANIVEFYLSKYLETTFFKTLKNKITIVDEIKETQNYENLIKKNNL
jgi:dsRNA-specific ribonuclease